MATSTDCPSSKPKSLNFGRSAMPGDIGSDEDRINPVRLARASWADMGQPLGPDDRWLSRYADRKEPLPPFVRPMARAWGPWTHQALRCDGWTILTTRKGATWIVTQGTRRNRARSSHSCLSDAIMALPVETREKLGFRTQEDLECLKQLSVLPRRPHSYRGPSQQEMQPTTSSEQLSPDAH